MLPKTLSSFGSSHNFLAWMMADNVVF